MLLLGPHPEKTGIRCEMWQNVVSSYVFEHLKLQNKINCVSLYKIAGNNSRYFIRLLKEFGEIVQIKDLMDVRRKRTKSTTEPSLFTLVWLLVPFILTFCVCV